MLSHIAELNLTSATDPSECIVIDNFCEDGDIILDLDNIFKQWICTCM